MVNTEQPTNGLDRVREICRILDGIYQPRDYMTRVRFDEHAVVWRVFYLYEDWGLHSVECGGMAIPYRELHAAHIPFNYFEKAIEALRGNVTEYERKNGYPRIPNPMKPSNEERLR